MWPHLHLRPSSIRSTARPLGIGNNPIEGGQYFIGALDNLKIYNKALTAAEIAQLYNSGTSSTEELNLVKGYVRQVFPNPSTDKLLIQHEIPASQSMLVRVFDTQGRQVDALRMSRDEVANGQFQLDVQAYPTGLYSINFVLGGKNIGSVKFMKN